MADAPTPNPSLAMCPTADRSAAEAFARSPFVPRGDTVTRAVDDCPTVQWFDIHRAIDALDDWGVRVTDSDGLEAVGVLRRVTQRGEEAAGEGWSDPEIYLVDIRDAMTDELVVRTDFRNFTTVVVL